jgi:uncharacterized coiled-coil protein SlyX
MNSNPDEQQRSSYPWLPITARIGFLLAVAIVIFLLARSCNESNSRLELSRTLMIRERDSIANVIKDIRDHLTSVHIENDTLFQKLENESTANKILLSEKAVSQKKLKISDATIKDQSEKINVLSENNGSLLATIEALQSRIDDLDMKLAQSENKAQSLDNNITELSTTLREKDENLTMVTESMSEQHRIDSARLYPVFISAGELESGLGINNTAVPYSQYFFGGSVLFGMEFNKRFLGGIGAGAHVFNGGTLVPVFLEFRYGFPIKNFTPFIFSKGGPLLNFSGYSHSNLFLNAGIGLRHQVSYNLALNFGTGIYSHNSGVSGRDSFINFNLGLIYSNIHKSVK